MIITVAFFNGLSTKSETLFSVLFEKMLPDLIPGTNQWRGEGSVTSMIASEGRRVIQKSKLGESSWGGC